MPHDTPLISTIVAGLVLAFVFGAIANRLRMPPLVGYLIAGVLVGPFTPGFVANQEIALELSEIGVILLMFGVGLHFSLKDLLSVRTIALPGAAVQIGGATLMGLGLALLLGWTIGAGLIFGLALSVASTVVLLKALQDRHMIDSEKGRIAVGWLIVEDIAMVLALVLIPAIATFTGASSVEIYDPFVSFVERLINNDVGIWGVLAITVVKLAAFVGFMLIVGRRVIPYILHFTAHTGSRELFRLAVLVIALGVAVGAAYLFGVSLALGAFFAGMILSESELSHRAAQETLPLRDAFAVLFFVAVGMLFDPMILLRDPLPVLATVTIIIVGKSVLAFFIVVAFRRRVETALVISASLAQIGEFSFILAALGVTLGMLPPEGRDLILAGAIISIIANPAVFWLVERVRPSLEARLRQHAEIEPVLHAEPELTLSADGAAGSAEAIHATMHTGHTVLIGYGRVGTVVAEGLQAAGQAFVLIEDAEGRVQAAHAAGIEVIVGNAASAEVLRLANVAGAATVIIAIPNAFEAGQATEQCRKANPEALIIARAHFDEEEEHLLNLGATAVMTGEREIAMGILERIGGARRGDVEPPAAAEPAAMEPLPAFTEPLPEFDASAELDLAEADVPELPPPVPVRRPARTAASPYATVVEQPSPPAAESAEPAQAEDAIPEPAAPPDADEPAEPREMEDETPEPAGPPEVLPEPRDR